MTQSSFETLHEEIRAFNFDNENAGEWQQFFDAAVKILDCDDAFVKRLAIHRFYQGLREERNPYGRHKGARASVEARLAPMLDAIGRQTNDFESCLMTFAHWMNWGDDEVRNFSLSWLNKGVEAGALTRLSRDVELMAKLELDDFPKSSWKEAENYLIPLFSSNYARLRVAAGGALARLYEKACEGSLNSNGETFEFPDLEDVLVQIKDLDIKYPGIAGPFWSTMQYDISNLVLRSGESFDVTRWMLEMIEMRNGDEPQVECYNGIDFHAHEQMAGDPLAIRKLIDIGELTLAASAATELYKPIAGMQEILIELARIDEEFTSRVCCWNLAYSYDYLHPLAQRKGFVRRIEREDVHIYFVYSSDHEQAYAATIYPNEGTMDDLLAWTWINKLVPKPGPRTETPEPEAWNRDPEEASVDYGGTVLSLYGDADTRIWKRVWIKWPRETGW